MFPLKERLVPGEKYMLYEYEPSKVAPIVFIALFGITIAIHTFQLVRRRTWYFIPFVIGGLCKFNLLLFILDIYTLLALNSTYKTGVHHSVLHPKSSMSKLRR